MPQIGPLENVVLRLRGQMVFDDDGELLRPKGAGYSEHEAPFARISLCEVAQVEAVDDRLQHERRAVEIELPVGRARPDIEHHWLNGRPSEHGKTVDGLVGQPSLEEALGEI